MSKGNPVAEVIADVADVTFAGDFVVQVPCAVAKEDHVAAAAQSWEAKFREYSDR